MPFVQVDPIEEARELQKAFADDAERRALFAGYEKAHIDEKTVEKEIRQLMLALRAMREEKGITQKELQERTGLSQQAISRMEVNAEIVPNFRNVMKYALGIGCSGLHPQGSVSPNQELHSSQDHEDGKAVR